MVTIGSTDKPGTITTIESATSSGVNLSAPGNVLLVGQADLANGNASAGEVKRITRPKQAITEFGDPMDSVLAYNVREAIFMGAWPVYAIAADTTDVSSEDLSGASTQSASLSNAPIVENVDDISITVNSTTKDITFVYNEAVDATEPDVDHVRVNPVTGEMYADEAFGNTGDEASYTYLSYSGAFDTIKTATNPVDNTEYIRDIVDIVYSLTENQTIVDDLVTTVDEMESNGWYALAKAGAGEPYISSASSYTNPYDNSRVQLMYPSRDSDGNSILGADAGYRSQLGIDGSPIFGRLTAVSKLAENPDDSAQVSLINAGVVPVVEQSGGAKLVEDVTTVQDGNTQEAAWTQSFSRMVTDYVAEIAEAEAEPFIGRLNTRGARNQLSTRMSSELKSLLASQQIQAYSLVVQEDTATKVDVDIGINVTDPIKNIETTISAGDVRGGTE